MQQHDTFGAEQVIQVVNLTVASEDFASSFKRAWPDKRVYSDCALQAIANHRFPPMLLACFFPLALQPIVCAALSKGKKHEQLPRSDFRCVSGNGLWNRLPTLSLPTSFQFRDRCFQ